MRPEVRCCPRDGSELRRVPEDPLIGTIVGGRYEIVSVLAEGGMGRVYKARADGALFALKVLFGELSATANGRRRFCRGAALAASVQHPNVMPVLDAGETDSGNPFLVTPLMSGRLLSSLLRDEAPLRVERACDLFRGGCSGVAAIHGEGILHRDLKASNILIRSEGQFEIPVVLDFGIAILTSSAAATRLTRPDKVVGTASYLAPERIKAEPFDERSDLFSLGVVFYRMLCGAFPYTGAPLWRAVQSATSNPPSMKERTGLSVFPPAERIARRLIDPDPAKRYSCAGAVIEAVDACLSDFDTLDS